MKHLLQLLQRESLWPLLVAVVAMVVLLPALGNVGFVEPQEISIADKAHERMVALTTEPDERAQEGAQQPPADARAAQDQAAARADQHGRGDSDDDGSDQAAQASATPERDYPLFEERVMARGMQIFGGDKELGARLPLALLGVLCVLATFFLGRRLGSPRAGLMAALILLSFPLLVLESRQLMSDIGAVLGNLLAVLGLVGLAWPQGGRGHHPLWHYPVDVALTVAGLAIGYDAAGMLLGVAAPLGGVGLASLAGLTAAGERQPDGGSGRASVGLGLGLMGVGLSLLVAGEMMTLDRAIVLGGGLLPALAGAVLFALGVISQDAPTARDPAVRWRRMHLGAMAWLGIVGGLVAVAVVLAAVFELRPPVPGDRALFGYSVAPTSDYVAVLGGRWRSGDNPAATFNSLFEQIAFGTYPWSALAPLAIAHLAMGPRRGRATWAGFVPLAWALLAWAVAVVMARKVAPVHYPALGAMAVAAGLWLDHLLGARQEADATSDSDLAASRGFGMPLRLPLVALFGFSAALVLGKDMQAFPDQLTALASLDTSLKYPQGTTLAHVPLRVYWLLFGTLFGLTLGGGLWLWERHKRTGDIRPPWYPLGRHGLSAAVAVGVCFSLFLVHAWLPGLAHKLSSKHLYEVYEHKAEPGAPLGVMGNPGSGLTYYAGEDYERLKNRNELVSFLRRPERVFALAPASDLCALHRSIKGQYDYFVLDNSHATFLLLSNQLGADERNLNPLDTAIVREPPTPERPLRVIYDNRVELIGMDMPTEVKRGDTFEATLYFKVLRPVGGNWKIFMHFDGAGVRFQGDHEPIEGRCGTTYWQAGDYIIDRVEIEAGNVTFARGEYTLFVGFFRGSHGNWTNMPVSRAEDGAGATLNVDNAQRVNLGRIQVQ
ncbi:ArnT family glycosyltransferase [Haliangium sp.]|uniref:ArnT family glycosyltransferase n=1 Tax=Haliangium sp. TaxID=2663208 RepID=UPI003D0CEE92